MPRPFSLAPAPPRRPMTMPGGPLLPPVPLATAVAPAARLPPGARGFSARHSRRSAGPRGQRNVRRGELFTVPPTGYAKPTTGDVAIAPGESVRPVVRPALKQFERLGTTRTTLRYRLGQSIRAGARAASDPNRGPSNGEPPPGRPPAASRTTHPRGALPFRSQSRARVARSQSLPTRPGHDEVAGVHRPGSPAAAQPPSAWSAPRRSNGGCPTTGAVRARGGRGKALVGEGPVFCAR
jgi:hypothetical protein